MSENEVVETLKELITRCKECKFATCENCEINWNEVQAIETILDLYQQEKEKNKEFIDLHYVPYEQYITKLNEVDEKWKDKIRDMQRYREFELQQQYKDFEDDGEWKAYKKILGEE